jgi:hypothetical protein
MNYKDLTPQEVKDMEVEHVDELLEKFEYARLCDKIGCQIVSEFDFKGSKNEVWEQLLGYREFIEDFTFDDAFIKELIVRKDLLDAFEGKFDTDKKEVHNAVKEFLITKDMDKLVDATATLIEKKEAEATKESKRVIIEGNELLHEMKLCLCFNNK